MNLRSEGVLGAVYSPRGGSQAPQFDTESSSAYMLPLMASQVRHPSNKLLIHCKSTRLMLCGLGPPRTFFLLTFANNLQSQSI